MKKNKGSARKPFFSVVVPLYNKEGYLARSLGSVLGQSFGDLELIVVDDGSQDGGVKVASAFRDKRFHLIRQKNAGVSAARNRGVARARGRYVAFLDADDEWDLDYLKTLKGLIGDFPGAGLYALNFWVDDGRGRRENPLDLPRGWRGILKDYYGMVYRKGSPIQTSAACVPLSVARRVPFPPGIKSGEDLWVWFTISLGSDIAYLNDPKTVWYVEAAQNAHVSYFGPRYHLNWADIGRDLRKEGRLPEGADRFISWASLVQARKMIQNGRGREALALLARCPKNHLPLRQAALYLSLLRPLKRLGGRPPLFYRGGAA